MKTWKNFEESPDGNITLEIGDRRVSLRYTVYQMERLEEILKAEAPEDITGIKAAAESDISICEVALNPEPGVPAFTRQDIVDALDLDRIKALAQYWLTKKVFSSIPIGVDSEKK